MKIFFKDIVDFKQHTEIGNVNFETLRKSIRTAQQAYILPILGKALYNSLLSDYEAAAKGKLTEKNELLVYAIQEALAPLAHYHFLPKSATITGETGDQRIESASNKTPYQYQVTQKRAELFDEGMKMIEQLYSHMEENAADFPSWIETDEYRKGKSLFIKTSKQFNDCINTLSPCRNYYTLQSYLYDTEQLILREAITADQFDAIKEAELAPDDLSAEEKNLINFLSKASVFLALSNAIPAKAITMDEYGLNVMDTGTSGNENISKRKTADNQLLSSYARYLTNTGEDYLTKALKYLKDKASVAIFPEYYAYLQAQLSQSEITDTTNVNDGMKSTFTFNT